jgi:lipoate-protein ligase A
MRCENCGTRGAVSRNRGRVTWRFVDTGYADPFFNMALDEALAAIAEQGEGRPTVRVYGWKPAAVSIGYSQRALAAVNVKKVVRLGIPLVRRLTGGRAVFHDQEVTYSVIAPKGQLGAPQSILKAYRRIGQALVVCLGHLGVSAHLSRVVSRGWGPGVRSALSPCFSSFGRYEVLVGHRKVVGSAQRRIGGILLQHGSLLTGEGYLRIAQLLPVSDEANRQKIVQELRKKTISLGALLSRRVSYAEVASALFLGFQEVLSSSLEPGELWPEEKTMAQRLVRERYRSQEWTLRR